jgi:hypothetical protein
MSIYWVKNINRIICSLNQILSILGNFDVRLGLFFDFYCLLHDATIFSVTIVFTRAGITPVMAFLFSSSSSSVVPEILLTKN